MKTYKVIFSLAIATMFLIGCKNSDSKPNDTDLKDSKKEKLVANRPEKATFHIEGMTCAVGCAKSIEEKLSEMDGVQNAKVDFESKTATVNYDLDKLAADDLVKAAESCADGKTYKVSDVKVGI